MSIKRMVYAQTWVVGVLEEAGLVVAAREVAGCFTGTTRFNMKARSSATFTGIEEINLKPIPP